MFTQKRDFFRLDCHIPTSFTLLAKDELGKLVIKDSYEGIISNISGGGVNLVTEIELAEKVNIFIRLRLDEEEMFLVGEIRVKYSNPDEVFPFQYGVMFSDISALEQEKIIKYLFKLQKNLTKPKRIMKS